MWTTASHAVRMGGMGHEPDGRCAMFRFIGKKGDVFCRSEFCCPELTRCPDMIIWVYMKIVYLPLIVLFLAACQSVKLDESPIVVSPGFYHLTHTPAAQANLEKAGASLDAALTVLQADGRVKDPRRVGREIVALLDSEKTAAMVKMLSDRIEREMLAEDPKANVDKLLVYETEKSIGAAYDRLMASFPAKAREEFGQFVKSYQESVIQSRKDPEDYRQFYRDEQSGLRSEVYMALWITLERYALPVPR